MLIESMFSYIFRFTYINLKAAVKNNYSKQREVIKGFSYFFGLFLTQRPCFGKKDLLPKSTSGIDTFSLIGFILNNPHIYSAHFVFGLLQEIVNSKLYLLSYVCFFCNTFMAAYICRKQFYSLYLIVICQVDCVLN